MELRELQTSNKKVNIDRLALLVILLLTGGAFISIPDRTVHENSMLCLPHSLLSKGGILE